jgi:hypothetical protein
MEALTLDKLAVRDKKPRLLKAISKVGMELEGGWSSDETELHRLSESGNARVCHDGSVDDSDSDCGFWGEVVTRNPLKEQEVDAWIDKWFPDSANDSCGFHVHISLKNVLFYSILMSRSFYRNEFTVAVEEFLSRTERTNSEDARRLRKRWQGSNGYCKRNDEKGQDGEFIIDEDLQAAARCKDGFRYRHLNFCYTLHKTMECRLAPMFYSTSLTKQWVHQLCECVNKAITNRLKTTPRDMEWEADITPESLCRKEEYEILPAKDFTILAPSVTFKIDRASL